MDEGFPGSSVTLGGRPGRRAGWRPRWVPPPPACRGPM